MKCLWANEEIITSYHDNEHGYIETKNNILFERLTLELFQPGLSFKIVLKKREGLKSFFKNYNLLKISEMNESNIILGLNNSDIIRHRKK